MRAIDEVMTRGVVTVTARTPVVLARRIAGDVGIRHLVVTRKDDIAGVLCMCDLRTLADQEAVEAAMASPVVTIEREASLERAAAVMRERRVGCLPVTSSSRLVGIVTRGDLARAGFGDEQLGILRCASCGYGHNVVTSFGTPGVGFCLYCRERSVPPDDWTDLGGG